MKYAIELTKQYLKDLKQARKRGLDENKLNEVIIKLISSETLPLHNRDHTLIGNYKGYRECHITSDWLLIYKRDITVKIVTLVRTGSHSDLF